jgi:hypothetical protein
MHSGFFSKAAVLAILINAILLTHSYISNSNLKNNPSDSYIYFKSVTPEEQVKIDSKNQIFLEGLQIKRVFDMDKYLGSAKLI